MFFFFFNDTATTEIYTLSLHDALPISAAARARPHRRGQLRAPEGHAGRAGRGRRAGHHDQPPVRSRRPPRVRPDRKSTRLNSSHANISYAVFCLKKKHKRNTLTYSFGY